MEYDSSVANVMKNERMTTMKMASRIDTILPMMKNALWCLVEMLATTPNKNGIIEKMIISTIFKIVMNNVSVGSIISILVERFFRMKFILNLSS